MNLGPSLFWERSGRQERATVHGKESQDVLRDFGRPEYEGWLTKFPHVQPLEAKAVPASLLSEFRRQLGGSDGLDAAVDIYSGGFREFTTPNSSYVGFATTDFATTFPRSTAATFD